VGVQKYDFQAIKQNNTVICSLLILLACIVNFGYYYAVGVCKATDTVFYLRNASYFLANGFEGLVSQHIPFYYWLYPVFLSMFIKLFGNSYQSYVIVTQVILISVSCLFIYKIGADIFNQNVGLIAALIYIFSWEIFRWAEFVLTDSMYIFLFLACIYYSVKIKKHLDAVSIFILGIMVCLIIMLRPTALVLGIILGFSIAIMMYKEKKYKVLLISVGTVSIVVAILLSYSGLGNPNSYGLSWFKGYFGSLFLKGQVISGMPEYDFKFWGDLSTASLAEKIGYYSLLILRRIIAFWTFYFPKFSFSHNLLSILTVFPVIVFGVFGMIKSTFVKSSTNWMLICLILLYTLFHSMTDIDYDQRYRAPILSLLTIYAAYGVWLTYSKCKPILMRLPKFNRFWVFIDLPKQ